MNIRETERGFSYSEFRDLNGAICSIQDSSIASEACLWLGVSKHADGSLGNRMHLTIRMAERVAHAIRGHLSDGEPHIQFTDRYNCDCLVSRRGDGMLDIGVAQGGDDRAGPALMTIDADTAEQLLHPLRTFIACGTISGEHLADLDENEPPVEMDVKIPVSMLARTEIGATGASARTLVDALLTLLDGNDVDSLSSAIGQDSAEDMMRLHKDLQVLRRD